MSVWKRIDEYIVPGLSAKGKKERVDILGKTWNVLIDKMEYKRFPDAYLEDGYWRASNGSALCSESCGKYFPVGFMECPSLEPPALRPTVIENPQSDDPLRKIERDALNNISYEAWRQTTKLVTETPVSPSIWDTPIGFRGGTGGATVTQSPTPASARDKLTEGCKKGNFGKP